MAMKELILEKLQHRYLTEISIYLLYILKEKKIKEEGKEQEERKRERSKPYYFIGNPCPCTEE